MSHSGLKQVPDEDIKRRTTRAEQHESVYKRRAQEALAEKSQARDQLQSMFKSRTKWKDALSRLVLEHELDGTCWCTDDGSCRTWARLAELNKGIARQVEAMYGLGDMALDQELNARELEKVFEEEDAEVQRRVEQRLAGQGPPA
jgi:hypothetical protein